VTGFTGRKRRIGVSACGRVGVRKRWGCDTLGTFLTDGTYETNRTNAIWVGFAFPVRCILSPSPRPDEDEDSLPDEAFVSSASFPIASEVGTTSTKDDARPRRYALTPIRPHVSLVASLSPGLRVRDKRSWV
jgi:hypothetical protein